MATYTQGIDPNSFQTTGYQLPVNQIIQAVATRNAYWDSNASALKSSYNRTANMALTLDQNKAELTNLMKGVDAGISKAVRSDLSIAPNLNDAMRVFDPVVKNENIQGDRAITEHYNKEFQLADSFKTKDNGKEYSPTNVRDLAIGLDKFRQNNDPNSWREHYASRRTYTPFYDVQAEVRALRQTFKPNMTTTTTPQTDAQGNPNGMYLTTHTDKSSYENQWKAYLSSNLSDKARTQLAINGRVAYYGQPQALLRSYADYTENKIVALSKERSVINGTMEATTDEQLKQSFIERLGQLDDDIKDLSQERDKMRSGDLSTLQNNDEAIASLVYQDSYISNLARGLQVIDQEVTYKPDAVRMKVFGEAMENYRMEAGIESRERIASLNRTNQLLMAQMKAKTDAEGDPLNWKPSTLSSGAQDNQSLTKDLYDQQVSKYQTALSGATAALFSKIAITDPKVAKMNPIEREAFLQTWVTQDKNKNSLEYRNYKSTYDLYNNQKAARDLIVEEATAEAKAKYPKVFLDQQAVIPTATVQGKLVTGEEVPVTLTNDDLKNFYLGTSSNIRQRKNVFTGLSDYFLTDKNGIEYKISGEGALHIDLATAKFSVRYGNAGDKVKEIIESNVTESLQIEKPDTDQFKNAKMISARQGIQRELGLSKAALDDITVYGRNQFGMYYNIPASADEKMGISRNELDERVTANGGKIVTQQGQKLYFIPYELGVGGTDEFYTNPQLAPIQSYFDLKKAKNVNTAVMAPSQINYEPNNTGEAFTFNMTVLGGKPYYYPVHKNTRKQIGGPFDSLEEAAQYLDSTFLSGKPEAVKQYLKGY